MLFDQVVLKQQGIDLSARHRHLDILNSINQCHGLSREPTCAKITRHAIFKIFCLTNVQQIALFSVHLIDTRPRRQALQVIFSIKNSHLTLSPETPNTSGSITSSTPNFCSTDC